MAIAKKTSNKWLPQVQTDKKKLEGTRITIGAGDMQPSPFHMQVNMRATQQLVSPQHYNLQEQSQDKQPKALNTNGSLSMFNSTTTNMNIKRAKA